MVTNRVRVRPAALTACLLAVLGTAACTGTPAPSPDASTPPTPETVVTTTPDAGGDGLGADDGAGSGAPDPGYEDFCQAYAAADAAAWAEVIGTDPDGALAQMAPAMAGFDALVPPAELAEDWASVVAVVDGLYAGLVAVRDGEGYAPLEDSLAAVPEVADASGRLTEAAAAHCGWGGM